MTNLILQEQRITHIHSIFLLFSCMLFHSLACSSILSVRLASPHRGDRSRKRSLWRDAGCARVCRSRARAWIHAWPAAAGESFLAAPIATGAIADRLVAGDPRGRCTDL
jgi:hypothetical protein